MRCPLSVLRGLTFRRRPLWVISGYVQCKTACPLYPRKRTFVRTSGIRSGGDGNKLIIAFDGGWLCRAGVSAQRTPNCASFPDMLKRETFPVANIYVPTARRKTLDSKRVDAIAHSMLTEGQQTPILVRVDGARFVLVEGLHRLEAAKALGEASIVGYRVDARKH